MTSRKKQTMKVFLSWSGEHSNMVAEALNELLRHTIRSVDPFFSPKIDRGSKWGVALRGALQSTRFGIVCLTPENLTSTWIHYEVGALSKTKDAKVCTFLHNVELSDVPPPLSDFQHTVAEKADVLELLKTINKCVGKAGGIQLQNRVLEKRLDVAWLRMEEKLASAKRKHGKPCLTLASFGELTEIEEVKTFVGDWYSITINGVHKLVSGKPIRSMDLLSVYRAGPMNGNFATYNRTRVRVCMANMFDNKLNEMYRRLYKNKTAKQLRDWLRESIQKLLGPCTFKVSAKGICVKPIGNPLRASFEIRLTNQRITFGYFRANEVASIMPLDMKTKQKPPPVAWLLDKDKAPLTFNHYLKQFDEMFDEALRIYPN